MLSTYSFPVINAIVDPDNGNVSGIVEIKDGFTSPLIILSNYYAGDGSGNASTMDSFQYAGSDYVSISNAILSERQGISVDRLEGDVSSAIKTLRDSILNAKKDGMEKIFNKATSYDYINSLVMAVQEKMSALKSQLSSKTITPEMKAEIDSLKKTRDDLSNAVTKLESEAKKTGANINDLKKTINDMKKDNARLSKLLDKLGGADSVQAITEELTRLKKQVAQRDSRIKELETNGTARENKLKRMIEFMQNDPRYMTAKEIRDAYDNLFDSIRKSITSGDVRVSAQLAMIFNALNGKTGTEDMRAGTQSLRNLPIRQ